jgi:hypothetical protein
VKQIPDVILNSKFYVRRWLAALTAAICLSGSAAHAAPPAAIIQEGPAAPALPDIDHVGVFVDGAIDFADMSGNFIDIADSRIAVAQLAEKTNAELVRIGCAVDFTETPFVGGLLGRAPVPAAQNRDAKPAPMAPPFDLGSGIDPDYETALQNVSLAVAAAFAHPALLMDLGAWSPAARDGLAAIAARRQVHYLLVVQGLGHIESGMRQAAEGVATAALSTLFTFGRITVSVRNVSWLDSHVMLIDLQKPHIVWSNSVLIKNLNPGEPADYVRQFWSGRVLYQLPGRAKPAAAPAGAG